MSALTRMRNTLLGSVAAAAVLGSIIAPAASAAVLPVSAVPPPVLQGGASGEHPISVRVLAIYMHDDGDGVAQGCGEVEHDMTGIKVWFGNQKLGEINTDNGTSRTTYYDSPNKFVDYTQHYCSDHNYPMPQSFSSDNKLFAKGVPGYAVDLRSSLVETDLSTIHFAFGDQKVVIPPVGKETVVNFDVESNGSDNHIRATFTVRIATSA